MCSRLRSDGGEACEEGVGVGDDVGVRGVARRVLRTHGVVWCLRGVCCVRALRGVVCGRGLVCCAMTKIFQVFKACVSWRARECAGVGEGVSWRARA